MCKTLKPTSLNIKGKGLPCGPVVENPAFNAGLILHWKHWKQLELRLPMGLRPQALGRIRVFATPWSPPGPSVPGSLQSKNSGVGCPFLLREVFPTPRSNLWPLRPPASADRFFPTSSSWEALDPACHGATKPKHRNHWAFCIKLNWKRKESKRLR